MNVLRSFKCNCLTQWLQNLKNLERRYETQKTMDKNGKCVRDWKTAYISGVIKKEESKASKEYLTLALADVALRAGIIALVFAKMLSKLEATCQLPMTRQSLSPLSKFAASIKCLHIYNLFQCVCNYKINYK